jgi:hypothetical protein
MHVRKIYIRENAAAVNTGGGVAGGARTNIGFSSVRIFVNDPLGIFVNNGIPRAPASFECGIS